MCPLSPDGGHKHVGHPYPFRASHKPARPGNLFPLTGSVAFGRAETLTANLPQRQAGLGPSFSYRVRWRSVNKPLLVPGQLTSWCRLVRHLSAQTQFLQDLSKECEPLGWPKSGAIIRCNAMGPTAAAAVTVAAMLRQCGNTPARSLQLRQQLACRTRQPLSGQGHPERHIHSCRAGCKSAVTSTHDPILRSSARRAFHHISTASGVATGLVRAHDRIHFSSAACSPTSRDHAGAVRRCTMGRGAGQQCPSFTTRNT